MRKHSTDTGTTATSVATKGGPCAVRIFPAVAHRAMYRYA